jgi:hypothetical protein
MWNWILKFKDKECEKVYENKFDHIGSYIVGTDGELFEKL